MTTNAQISTLKDHLDRLKDKVGGTEKRMAYYAKEIEKIEEVGEPAVKKRDAMIENADARMKMVERRRVP